MISTRPYKGITLEFDEVRHRFFANGRPVLGVTSATGMIDKSRPLIYWAVGLSKNYLLEKLYSGQPILEEDIVLASKLHQTVKEDAATRGKAVHQWAEDFIKGKNPRITTQDEQVRNGIQAFLKWVKETDIKFIKKPISEAMVYSKKYDYAGILDLEAKINNKLVIVDFKTSKGVYNEMRYQVAAYQNAREEMTGKTYGNRILVRFDKETGDFHLHELDNQKADFKAFVGALAIKRREQELTTYH
jgi:hypothetical protein